MVWTRCIPRLGKNTESRLVCTFSWVPCACLPAGRRSHVGGRRCSWDKAHRAAPLAHVLWAVHRSRFFLPGTLEPPIEIAFGSAARATSASGSIQYDFIFHSHDTPTDHADFLARSSALRKCLQGLSTTCIRRSGSNAITGRVKRQDWYRPAGYCRRLTATRRLGQHPKS